MTTCSSCESNGIPQDATYCPYCGSRLDGSGLNGFSISAIVLGIIGAVLCWVPWLGFGLSAVGVAVAIPAANKQQKLYEWALGISLLGALMGLSLSLIHL